MSERERWTPDQKLRADFTNDDLMARLTYCLKSCGDDQGLRDAVGPWFVLALCTEVREVLRAAASSPTAVVPRDAIVTEKWLSAGGMLYNNFEAALGPMSKCYVVRASAVRIATEGGGRE